MTVSSLTHEGRAITTDKRNLPAPLSCASLCTACRGSQSFRALPTCQACSSASRKSTHWSSPACEVALLFHPCFTGKVIEAQRSHSQVHSWGLNPAAWPCGLSIGPYCFHTCEKKCVCAEDENGEQVYNGSELSPAPRATPQPRGVVHPGLLPCLPFMIQPLCSGFCSAPSSQNVSGEEPR